MPGGAPDPAHFDPKKTESIWNAPPDPAELRELARRLDAMADKMENVSANLGYAVDGRSHADVPRDLRAGAVAADITLGWHGSAYIATVEAVIMVKVVLQRTILNYREFATSVRALADEAEKAWKELEKKKILLIFGILFDVATLFFPIGRVISALANGMSRVFASIVGKLGGVMPKNAFVTFVYGQLAMLPISLVLWGVPEVVASVATGVWSFDPMNFGIVFGLGAVFAHPFFWSRGKPDAAGAGDVRNVGGASGPRPNTSSSSATTFRSNDTITTLDGSGLGFAPKSLVDDALTVSPPSTRPESPVSTLTVSEVSARTPPPVRDEASAGGPVLAGAAPPVGLRGNGRGPSVENVPDVVVPPPRSSTASLLEAAPPGGLAKPPAAVRDIPPPATTTRGGTDVPPPAEGTSAVPRLSIGGRGEPVPPLRMEPTTPVIGERWVPPTDVAATGVPRGGAVELPGVVRGGAGGGGSVPHVGAPAPRMPGVREVVPSGLGEQAVPPVERSGGVSRGGAVELPGVVRGGAGGGGSVPHVGSGAPALRIHDPAHLGTVPPNVRSAPPSPHGGPDGAGPALGAAGRRQVEVSLSPGHELSAADSRAVGKLSTSNGSVVIRSGEGQFPASGLPSLRRAIWAGAEGGELVVPASRVTGLPMDRSVVPTLRGRPVPAADADEFRVFGSEAKARSAHPTWSPVAQRSTGPGVTSVGEESVAARQAAGVRPPTHELPGESVPTPHDRNRPWSLEQPSGSDVVPRRAGASNFGDPVGADPAHAANVEWTRRLDGLHETHNGGSLRLGDGGTGPGVVHIPPGSKAVLDGAGELRLVIRPDGRSFDRDLAGAWSMRTGREEITVSRLTGPERLSLTDGRTITLRSGDEVRHAVTGDVVAYRVGRDSDVSDAVSGNTFLRGADGRWSVADIHLAEFQGWLASANRAAQAARALFDIAERYGPKVAAGSRLNELDDAAIARLLRSERDGDVTAAVYEVIRRHTGMEMRWTQADAVDGLTRIEVVNMAAGEGKSLAYHAAVGRLAFGRGVAQYITTRDNLAVRDAEALRGMYEPYGAKIHRMNEEGNVPKPVPGEPTIYAGTHNDIGFSFLGGKPIPGRTAVMDEIDEALVFDDTIYQHSAGVGNPAPKAVAGLVTWARDFLNSHRASGSLTAADFNLGPGRRGESGLTGQGLTKVERILGRMPSAAELKRLNLAAFAEFQYRYKTHYTLDQHSKIVIINQTTHKVMKDLAASTGRFGRETRWNDGLAQAIEAKHNLPIRADADTTKKVSAGQIYSSENYDVVVGASGTALGKEVQFARQGLSGTIRDVARYFKSKLVEGDDLVFGATGEKLDAVVAHAIRDATAGRPQWIIVHDNALVSKLSDLFKARNVDHTAVDADWFLAKGFRAEAAFQRVIDEGGQAGKITVVNMQGARGVDVPIGLDVIKSGGLDVKVTARSSISHDIDVQAMNRAGRSGHPGRAQFYVSLDDDLFVHAGNPRATVTVTRYEIARHADQDLPTLWSAADFKQAEADVRNLVPTLQAEAQVRFLASITPTPSLTAAGPAHAVDTGASASPGVGTPAEHSPAVPVAGMRPPTPARNVGSDGSTPLTVEDVMRPSGSGLIDPAVQLSTLRAAAPPGSGLEIRPLAGQPGYALTRDGGTNPVQPASSRAFGQRSVLVVSPGVSGAGDTTVVTEFLGGLPDPQRAAMLIDVGTGPRVPVDVVQGWADQGWTGPGGTAPIIVPADRLLEAPNSKWFVPYVDTNLLGSTSDHFAKYFLVYPSTGPAPVATPHDLPPSGVANQFRLGQDWVLDTARPGAALVSPRAGGSGLLPSHPLTGGPPGSMRLEVTDSATMPPAVKAQVHRLLSELPPTVHLVVDGRSGTDVASWRSGLEVAALAQRVPPGYKVEKVPAGYAVGRVGARLADLEAARTLPPLTGSVVIFLDPSIGGTAAVTQVLTAAQMTVSGQVVAHLNPSTAVAPEWVANTAGELRRRAGVPVLISANGLTSQPSPDQFLPVGSVAGHYLVLASPRRQSPDSAISDAGSTSDAASVTTVGTSVTTSSSYGDNEPTNGVSTEEIPSGLFLHGPEWSVIAREAATALPPSKLGTRIVPDAGLFAELGSLASAIGTMSGQVFIDPRFADVERTPERLAEIADTLGAPVVVGVHELSGLPPAHSIGLDEAERTIQGSGVATAFLVPPRAGNRSPSTNLVRLRVWRDDLRARFDGPAVDGPSAGNFLAAWRAFSDKVDNAAGRVTQTEVETVVRAYVDASAQLPTHLDPLPTVAQILGLAPPLTPLPNTTGADGRYVAGALSKALNALSLVAKADVRGAALGWNRWVSSLGTAADPQEVLKTATARVTDIFMAARPVDDPASVRAAALYLAGRGATRTVLGYLAEPDSFRSGRVIRAALPAADADLLKALRNLTRGFAKLNSENALVNMIGALANALERETDIPDLRDKPAMAAAVDIARRSVPGMAGAGFEADFNPNREMAAALGISREFIPRYFTNSERVDLVELINSMIARNPSRTNVLRLLAIAALDC